MKTKRKPVNVDAKMCSKKIMTRNMHHKIIEDKSLTTMATTTTSNCHINLIKKSTPKTRAKSTSSVNKDSDPYSFSKMDEESKIPIKKIKLTEKITKDVAVNTTSISTMTDPELLGPCEPGTAIELQGIVWMETATGLLVINVTWRGRTYVGTLLDSTKYELTPSFNFHDFPTKFESRHASRPNRGKKRFVSPGSDLRSTNIRHSRRLSESLSYPNNIKKSSARIAHNNSCYIDTLSFSADASLSGESDTDLNPYQKYSPTSKTRSVTRSLAKQNNVVINDIVSSETENSNSLIKCTFENCFKKFPDLTALRYHLQLTHQIFEEEVKSESRNIDQQHSSEEMMEKEESICEQQSIDQPKLKSINGKMEKRRQNFEFNSDTETEKSDGKLNNVMGERCIIKKEESVIVEKDVFKTEVLDNLVLEAGNNFPKSSEILPLISDHVHSLQPFLNQDKEKFSITKDPTPVSVLKLVTCTEVTTTHSGNIIRTVTAPTVSIPLEISTTSVTNTSLLSIPSISQSFTKSKSNQVSVNSSSHGAQSKPKMKPSKCHSVSIPSSFQIPSCTSLSKKRPLIPLKVSVTTSVISSTSRLLSSSSSSTKSITTNHSSRHIRSSSVTPILPANSTSNSLNSPISSLLNPSSVPCTLNSSFINTAVNSKRPIISTSNVSPSGMSSLLSLKPIQPKPKCTSNFFVTSNPTSSSLTTSTSTTNSSGLLTTPTSYQRQILPSPISKSENGNNSDDRVIHKIETVKGASIKKKRRKQDKKLKINFHECTRLKPLPLNPIQPKHKKEFKQLICQQTELSVIVDNYKMDEENSHSPGYSDLSETNDTPAPILEKEIELKSGECDKLIICTDFEPTSRNVVRSSCSDNSPYNKPPALMPAVLSTDHLNGSTNDMDLSVTPVKSGRRKVQTGKKTSDLSKCISTCSNESDFPTSLKHNNNNNNNNNNNVNITSSRKSFQSSSFEEKISPPLISSSKVSLYNSSQNDFHDPDPNPKLKIPIKCSNLSAINDYVWMTKNNQDYKSKTLGRLDHASHPSKLSNEVDSNKKKFLPPHSQPSNGRFSVQALTSPQEIVSRSLTTSSPVMAVNPNTKSSNTLFKS